MTSGTVRRAQLISPFGVGAMTVLVDGTSVLAAGLDHWFEGDNVQVSDFRIEEWRLQRRLRVSHFRMPPHYQQPRRGMTETNVGLTVPFLRFPTWSFCPYCKRMSRQPLAFHGKAHCPDPNHSTAKNRKGPAMAQVPFVVVCEHGHMDDFPWSEWVHRTVSPRCGGSLRLRSRGGGSLAGQVVSCDGCKESRSLEGVMTATGETTTLTSHLGHGTEYSCQGWRPWFGNAAGRCGQPLRGTLRGASNVYFPLVESSIYLPQSPSSTPETLLKALDAPDFSGGIALAKTLPGGITAEHIRSMDRNDLLTWFTDEQIDDALVEISGGDAAQQEYDLDVLSPVGWRRPEHDLLRGEIRHPHLVVTKPAASYGEEVSHAFSRVRLVELLRETRALWGFTRLKSSGLRLNEGKARLRLRPPGGNDWLPAYTVFGEGLYLELDENQLRDWENQPAVAERADRLADYYRGVQQDRGLEERDITPRLILIHTLAHLIINQLIFECGYSTASLRERLFVSSDHKEPMSGLLIYTAAGDAEGTMGGLVRMGKPGNLDSVWEAVLANAEWCSTDPICMEAGEAGQGPDSCNMAACHSCGLLPETSCEEFNRFLDRGLVIGSLKKPGIGFFSSAQ
jgi:hypothetical protein